MSSRSASSSASTGPWSATAGPASSSALPFWRRSFWSELWHEVRWYAFLEKEPRKYIGHNPLAHLFMVVIITVGGS